MLKFVYIGTAVLPGTDLPVHKLIRLVHTTAEIPLVRQFLTKKVNFPL